MSHEHPQDSVSLDERSSGDELARVCAVVAADPRRALAVIDVDEVLALFVQGFDRHLRGAGHELRMLEFSLLGSVYAAGETQPVAKEIGRDLLTDFFTQGCLGLQPAPHAPAALARLSQRAQIVILSAAPVIARTSRTAWLREHGLDYPLVISGGDKGPEVAALAAAAAGPVAFVDDILRNLDSVRAAAPVVARFQLVADPDLRRLAPRHADHPRVEDWFQLELQLEAALWRDPAPQLAPGG